MSRRSNLISFCRLFLGNSPSHVYLCVHYCLKQALSLPSATPQYKLVTKLFQHTQQIECISSNLGFFRILLFFFNGFNFIEKLHVPFLEKVTCAEKSHIPFTQIHQSFTFLLLYFSFSYSPNMCVNFFSELFETKLYTCSLYLQILHKFSKDKNILIHNHGTVIKIRKYNANTIV